MIVVIAYVQGLAMTMATTTTREEMIDFIINYQSKISETNMAASVLNEVNTETSHHPHHNIKLLGLKLTKLRK